jgi:hypothetical protein
LIIIKVKNVQAADEWRKDWYENADDIAEFLSELIHITISTNGGRCCMIIFL